MLCLYLSPPTCIPHGIYILEHVKMKQGAIYSTSTQYCPPCQCKCQGGGVQVVRQVRSMMTRPLPQPCYYRVEWSISNLNNLMSCCSIQWLDLQLPIYCSSTCKHESLWSITLSKAIDQDNSYWARQSKLVTITIVFSVATVCKWGMSSNECRRFKEEETRED